MAKPQTVRFASGSPDAPFSCVWRLIVNKDDVYIGASKTTMGTVKISLHKSGVWVLAATHQSGASFKDGNRRAKQWSRPKEHAPGLTRGPTILVPHTSLGSRLPDPDEGGKDMTWFPGPTFGKIVEFSMYFVEPNAPTKWDPDQKVLSEGSLARGSHLVLLASMRPVRARLLATVEKIIRENAFPIDPDDFLGGSLLWITQSSDARRVPIAVDLPGWARLLPTNAD